MNFFASDRLPIATLAIALIGSFLSPLPALAQGSEFKIDTGTGLGGLLAPKGGGSTGTDKDDEQAKKESEATEITSTEETSFDERSRTATFLGGVRVRDAQFNLSCDKLTAHLSRGGKDESSSDGKSGGGGLERAIAEGNVVIIQEKANEKGEITRYIGRAGRAEYVAATGEVTLSGWPQIQQGINNQVATEEGTVMILNRDGRLKTRGGSKTVIKDSSDASPTNRRADKPAR